MNMISIPNLPVPVAHYEVGKQLDRGTQQSVYQAVLTNTQELVAVKQIRHDHHVCVPGSVTREIVHMKLLCHDNICRLLDVVPEPDHARLWLVLPLQHFSLHHFLRSAHGCRRRPVPIEIVRTLTYQMLLGIQHSHQHSIVHGNLTPQHMLLDNVMRLKLTDFSHSVMMTTAQRPRLLTSTDLSVRAPEVLLGESYPSAPIDMWAAGCAMALMSNGLPLFQGHSVSEQLAKMFEILGTPTCKTWPSIDQLPGYNPHWSLTPIQQPTKQFRHLNEDGIDLVYRMLTLDPDRRITADQALAHPFFRNLH